MTGSEDVDPALVRAAQRGDPMALGELMEILAPYVGRICGPIALQDGPDAAQEALIIILRGIRGLKEPGALFGWARVIAVREAVRIARRPVRISAMPVDEIGAPGDPELAVDITDTLARLTPEHRAVLVLRDVEGLDELQAGRILSVPPGTVRSRLFRARRGFRRAWES
jgi:DNA-directed RNA polymerase specialized sigma24 family protein